MPRTWLNSLLFVVLLGVFTAAYADDPDALIGMPSVIDGDTIEIHGVRIRLHGIDAPETRQICQRGKEAWRCGRDAGFALANFIEKRTVRCESRGTDRYRRFLGVCHIGEVDVNAWLVEQGWAVAYRAFSLDYVEEEDSARAARRGIWASDFEMPWDWRRSQRR